MCGIVGVVRRHASRPAPDATDLVRALDRAAVDSRPSPLEERLDRLRRRPVEAVDTALARGARGACVARRSSIGAPDRRPGDSPVGPSRRVRARARRRRRRLARSGRARDGQRRPRPRQGRGVGGRARPAPDRPRGRGPRRTRPVGRRRSRRSRRCRSRCRPSTGSRCAAATPPGCTCSSGTTASISTSRRSRAWSTSAPPTRCSASGSVRVTDDGLAFVYKAAAEIGELGDNTARAARRDPRRRAAAPRPGGRRRRGDRARPHPLGERRHHLRGQRPPAQPRGAGRAGAGPTSWRRSTATSTTTPT